MKKKSLITILSLFVSVVLTGCSSFNFDIKKNAEQSEVITMRDIADFLDTKKEHYPLSDEFIERYQQKPSPSGEGYIDLAIELGLLVDKYQHEPNQKWHFFDSWLYPSIESGNITWDESAKSRVYSKLLCPELLLWIYEASGVNPLKVKAAKEVAEKAKVEGTHISTMASNMRKCVSWDDIEPAIIAFKNNTVDPFKVTVNQSDDFVISGLESEYKVGTDVSFSVNVTASNKAIDVVKANDTVLSCLNGKYSFKMPARDVTISVTLKDLVSATSVTLDKTEVEVEQGRDTTITATVSPSNSTDTPIWEVVEGENIVSIEAKDNKTLKVTGKNVGVAKVKVSYNQNVSAECVITVKEREIIQVEGSIAKYDIKFDLGTGKQSKSISDPTVLYNTFTLDGEGETIIDSVTQLENVYGGGYGGSGDTSWVANDMLKLGTKSVNGGFTLKLNTYVNQVKVTGYVHDGDSSCKVQVGDSNSGDWGTTSDNKTKTYTCTDMSLANKENVANNATSTITFDIEETNSLKIATINKKRFYITAIEFIYINK